MHSATTSIATGWMAAAATCLAGVGHAYAESASSYQVLGPRQHIPSGSSAFSGVESPFGNQIVLYVESDQPNRALKRETTDQEHLVAVLRHLEHYKADWDGEGAKAPLVHSLRAAARFVSCLPDGVEMPEPLLHASGNAALAWSSDGFYGEVEFLASGSIAYYFARGENKHKGVVAQVGDPIPPAIRVLLPTA